MSSSRYGTVEMAPTVEVVERKFLEKIGVILCALPSLHFRCSFYLQATISLAFSEVMIVCDGERTEGNATCS